MERRINILIQNYVVEFKAKTMKRAQELGVVNDDNVASLLQFVCDYDRLVLTADDFAKRQRIKHVVSPEERCNGKRGAGNQCTRRKQIGKEYCGTHAKVSYCENTSADDTSNTKNKTLEVWSEEINGIMYYVDAKGTIYDAEDVVCNKSNPKVLGKYQKETGETEWL